MATLKTGWIKKLINGVSEKIFAISHVKSVYYNYAEKKTLANKLDSMDKEISIAKTTINNLTTTSTGTALDAYQGKLLSDRIDTLTPSKVIVSCTTNGDTFAAGDSKSVSLPITPGVYILGIKSLYDDIYNGICWVNNYWGGEYGNSGIICINAPISISVTGKTLTITNTLDTDIRIRDVQITIHKIT